MLVVYKGVGCVVGRAPNAKDVTFMTQMHYWVKQFKGE